MKPDALDLLKSTIKHGLVEASQNENGEIWITTKHIVTDTRSLARLRRLAGARILEVLQPHDPDMGLTYHFK
jgi:hypothetical protein